MNNKERLKELYEKLKLFSINCREYEIPEKLFKNEINEFCYLFMTGFYNVHEFDLRSVFDLIPMYDSNPFHTESFVIYYSSFLSMTGHAQRISEESNPAYDILNNKEVVCSMLSSQQQITDDDFVLILKELRCQMQKMYVEEFLSNPYIFPKRRKSLNFSEKQIENLFSFLHIVPYEVQRAIFAMIRGEPILSLDSKMHDLTMSHYRTRQNFEQKECFKEFDHLMFENMV